MSRSRFYDDEAGSGSRGGGRNRNSDSDSEHDSNDDSDVGERKVKTIPNAEPGEIFDIKNKEIKGYTRALFSAAVSSNWEPNEIAKLAGLIVNTTQIRPSKLIKMIFKAGCSDPMLVSCLEDENITVSSSKKLNMMLSECNSLESLVGQAGRWLEEGILDLTDDKLMKKVRIRRTLF